MHQISNGGQSDYKKRSARDSYRIDLLVLREVNNTI